MPTLANIHSRILRNTRYMVSDDDIMAAVNEEGFLLYTRVLKEGEGFFAKTDWLTIALTPGTQDYACPADCTQIVHMAERAQYTDNWATMDPENQNQALEGQNTIANVYVTGTYDQSRFKYYGPYLPANQVNNGSPEADNASQIMQVTISPLIDVPRMVEIVYTAKWLAIVDDSSSMTLPEEATNALYSKVMANLTASIGDDRSISFANLGELQAKGFLTWVRDRQIQSPPRVTSYL